MTDTFDKLAPANVATTIRSLPRRVAQAWSAISVDARTEVDADGFSPSGRLAAIESALQAFDRAIELGSLRDSPTVDVDFSDLAGQVDNTTPARLDAIDLDGAAHRLAERVSSLPATDLTRPVRLNSGANSTIIELARHSARVSVNHLRKLEAAVTK